MADQRKIYENEQLISVPSGDYIMLDIDGNKTDGKETFTEDLAKGETIVKEFIVNLRPPVVRNLLVYYILCVLTLGLYYVYIHYCGCCREKLISVRRAKMVLTSLGRLGVWSTDTAGVQTKGVSPLRTITSNTKISWYKISDITHIQHYHYVRRLTEFFCFSSNSWQSSLRIFFGVFPDQVSSNALNAALPVPKSISMSSFLVPKDVARNFSVLAMLQAIPQNVFAVLSIVQSYAVLTVDDSAMLEIGTSALDVQHENPEAVYDALLDIQRALFEIKQAQPVLKSSPTTNFKYVDTRSELVIDNVAYLLKNTIPLVAGEELLDAYTFESGWTFMEILLTIVTLGIYWVAVVRFRHGLESAMVVSNYRLFEISQDMAPGICATGDNFTYIVRSWFLQGLDAGVMAREKFRMWSQIQTKYGALKIEPYIHLGFFNRMFFGIPADTVARTKRFLLQFAHSAETTQLLSNANSGSVPVPPMVSEDLKLAADEHLVGYIDGRSKFNGASCAGIQPPPFIGYFISCGKYPINIVQELVVTSHRILASATADNKPMCLDACLTPDYKYYFWSSLSSPYFLGSQITGNVTVVEKKWIQCLGPYCGCTPNTAQSNLSLAYAFSPEHKGYPVTVYNIQKNAQKGLLEDDSINAIRTILGNTQLARSNNYVATPRPADHKPLAIDIRAPTKAKADI